MVIWVSSSFYTFIYRYTLGWCGVLFHSIRTGDMDRLFHLYCILVDWDYTYIFIMLVAHDMEWLFACIGFYRIRNFIISCVLCFNVVSVHACQMCFFCSLSRVADPFWGLYFQVTGRYSRATELGGWERRSLAVFDWSHSPRQLPS